MAEVTNELMYEFLKKIQGKMTDFERNQRDLRDRIMSYETKNEARYSSLTNDISHLHRDLLRIEQKLDTHDDRLSRIERRLELVDA